MVDKNNIDDIINIYRQENAEEDKNIDDIIKDIRDKRAKESEQDLNYDERFNLLVEKYKMVDEDLMNHPDTFKEVFELNSIYSNDEE